jgi:hypothetical protein
LLAVGLSGLEAESVLKGSEGGGGLLGLERAVLPFVFGAAGADSPLRKGSQPWLFRGLNAALDS